MRTGIKVPLGSKGKLDSLANPWAVSYRAMLFIGSEELKVSAFAVVLVPT